MTTVDGRAVGEEVLSHPGTAPERGAPAVLEELTEQVLVLTRTELQGLLERPEPLRVLQGVEIGHSHD